MKSRIHNGYEISTDGRTVWVNSATGMCVARFSLKGMDIHHDIQGQIEGKHCLDCGPADWETFCQKVQQHYGVVIPIGYAPTESMK